MCVWKWHGDILVVSNMTRRPVRKVWCDLALLGVLGSAPGQMAGESQIALFTPALCQTPRHSPWTALMMRRRQSGPSLAAVATLI